MTSRLSKNSLQRVAVLDTEDLADERQEAIQQIASIADAEAIELVREIFAGTSLIESDAKINAVLHARRLIYEHWGRARENFLAIGRSLLRLETQFTANELRRLYESSDRLFPFSASLASQFRQIARAVDEGKLPEPQLPGAYSVAYQLAILTENELLLARERNLIRPNVRRSEVLTFRREIMGQTAIHGDLRQELRKLKGRQQSLQRELAEIQLRIEKIESLLAP